MIPAHSVPKQELEPRIPQKQVKYEIVTFGAGVVPNTRHIALLHAELLPRSPLTKLGKRFMERFYYKALSKQGLIFGAVAYVDGRPAGFISATYDSDHLLAHAIRWNVFRLAFVGLTTFPSPRRVMAVAESLGIVKSRQPKADIPLEKVMGGPTGEVLSVGVRKSYRSREFKLKTGLQIGADLMSGVMAGFAKSNVVRARLIIDSKDLVAQSFCRRLGWEPRRRSVPGWHTESSEYLWIRR
jgi:ribosomal protein S18 acetylase RimI-like enzyme